MTSPKKPGVAFWATVVVVAVLVAYPLSFGPACWVTSRANRGTSVIGTVYKPITWAMSPTEGAVLSRLINWYAEIGAPAGWSWRFTKELRENPDGTFTAQGGEWSWETVWETGSMFRLSPRPSFVAPP